MSTRVEAHPEPEGVQAYEAGFEWLAPRFAAEGFPWAQVAGYAGSLVLTLAALYLVVHHLLAPGVLAAVVLVLAAGQAGLQLGVFMHLREARGTAWQVLPLFLAFAIALGLVGMSVWVMAFKSGVS
ncbi:MAG: cytochrome C oxidase subunit IV family protein [Actinomycetia bacterium]|nr:cytochrome C oxidase subunit IV family protein [Actinomycetes bacterium]